jgi:hypothetical protein
MMNDKQRNALQGQIVEAVEPAQSVGDTSDSVV